MMTWSQRRQILYGGGALIVTALLLAYPLYAIFHKTPSCFDGKQNQNETGIDCGGLCSRACIEALTPLNTKWTRFFSVGGDAYDVAASIENKNDTAGIPELNYTFKLLDSSGAMIGQAAGSTFVNAREEVILFAPRVSTGGKTPARVELTFEEHPTWLQVATDFGNRMTVRNQSLSGIDTHPQITATIVNPGPKDLSDVRVVAVVYNGRGEPVGVSSSVINTMPGDGGNVTTKFFWPLLFAPKAPTSGCTAPVDIMLALDRSGSMVGKPLTDAKAAAESFVETLTSADHAGVVSFATDASNPIESTLSGDHAQVKSAIDSIVIGTSGLQYTNLGDAIAKAHTELISSRVRDGVKKAIVLLTDGVANRPEDPANKSNTAYPEDFAAKEAQGVIQDGVTLYVIGLGRDLNTDFLKENIASAPEDYYAAASSSDLKSIYGQISEAVCKAEIFTIKVLPRVQEVAL